VSHAIADNAFRRRYTSPEEIFALEIPAHKTSLNVRFKKEILNRPIFRDIEKMPSGSKVLDTKALPYSKCRDHFVWLGRVAGFEQPLELYQLRRASGRKMNSECSILGRDDLFTELSRRPPSGRTKPDDGSPRRYVPAILFT
jgi:hypothetical protein